MKREIRNFVTHLRLRYQVLILSGPFLLGVALAPQRGALGIAVAFVALHVLLFGGSTVYNSFWDKDEGPIGGLVRPPETAAWFLPASLVIQFLGLEALIFVSSWAAAAAVVGMVCSWFYSSPRFRWKGRPLLSLLAIGVGTGLVPVVVGYGAASGLAPTPLVFAAALGATLLLLSAYPLSQVYQVEEDSRRGDRTFAATFGPRGVRVAFWAMYPLGFLLLAGASWYVDYRVSVGLLVAGTIAALVVRPMVASISGHPSEYGPVMRIKFTMGLLFALALAAVALL